MPRESNEGSSQPRLPARLAPSLVLTRGCPRVPTRLDLVSCRYYRLSEFSSSRTRRKGIPEVIHTAPYDVAASNEATVGLSILILTSNPPGPTHRVLYIAHPPRPCAWRETVIAVFLYRSLYSAPPRHLAAKRERIPKSLLVFSSPPSPKS
jgi:hypothetical protein